MFVVIEMKTHIINSFSHFTQWVLIDGNYFPKKDKKQM